MVAAVLAGVEAELVGVMAAAVEGRRRRRPLMCRMPLPLRLPSPLLIWRWVPSLIWGRRPLWALRALRLPNPTPLRHSCLEHFGVGTPSFSRTPHVRKFDAHRLLLNRSDRLARNRSFEVKFFDSSKSLLIQQSWPEESELMAVARTLGLRGGGAGESMAHNCPKNSKTASSPSSAFPAATLASKDASALASLTGGGRSFSF